MPHRNHGLFSDHYLGQHIPELAGDDLARAQSLKAQIAGLCAKAEATLPGRREANARKILITPVLELLGFACDDEPPLPTGMSTEAPDYALLASEETEKEAEQHRDQPAQFYARVLALAEAKRWDRPLSATAKKAKSRKDQRHPGKQTRDYLYESGVRWGILTNGRLWRLYEREASRGENYYEVDLPALASSDPQAWRYFYLFFRREAFAPDADGRRDLDKWLAESKDYAVGLTQRLRGNVYEALRSLMEGYFAERRNGLAWEQDWQRVRDASLVLLYRLLFVLYAEARGLMPLTNLAYRDRYSLQHQKAQIAQQLDAGRYDEFGSRLWSWLRDELFELVDKGDERLGVPQYNGGLFRAERWPLLHDARIRLPDCYLAQAVDLLARDAPSQRGAAKGFVDYSELGVRELGSIYEGLLEMRPHLATEPMIEAKRAPKDKGLSVLPESQATEAQKAWAKRYGGKGYDAGQVYLLTDRGERKQTGSYYTPEYIVNYIVENTLGALTDECARQVAERRPQAEKEIAKLEKAIAERGDETDTTAERAAVERLKLELLAPYFDLKVLDPAMGSGHFLVGAADFITDAILTDPNHLPTDEADGDEALYYKRLVVERCLYGVDINPLAVELAKLSLWLHTVQKDRALSFLDHHLRCGNSLMGAWIQKDLAKEPPIFDKRGKQTNRDSQQLVLGYYDTLQSRHLQSFLDMLAEIEGKPTVSAESEAEKNYLYRTLDEQRDPYRQVANLWLSPYFVPPASLLGVHEHPERPLPIAEQQYHDAVEALSAGAESADWKELAAQPWFQAAQKVAAEHRFFHWELEFPEVWYERGRRRGNPGFDAVIGNPPYGLSDDRDYLSRTCPATARNGDSFVAFMAQGLRVLRRSGSAGWIVPLAWQTGVNYANLCKKLLSDTAILSIVNLPFDVFPDAYVDTGIVILLAETPSPDWTVSTFAFPKTSKIKDLVGLTFRSTPQSRWAVGRGTIVLDPVRLSLLEKIETKDLAEPLGALTESARGILAREADVAAEPSGELWKPFLVGEVDRYEAGAPSCHVRYSDELPERPASFDFFVGPRMLIRRLVSRKDRIMAAFAVDSFVNKKDVYVFKSCVRSHDIGFLLALVNSAPLSFAYLQRDAAATKDDFRQTTLDGLRALPIRRIHFTTPAKERAALVRGLERMYNKWAAAQPGNAEAILGRVEELLPKDEQGQFLAFAPGATGAEEKSDVVHDFLAYLAEQMIELNKRKRAEVKRFLEWLRTEISHDLEDLRQKTRIGQYHQRNLDDLLAALRANDTLLNRIAHRSDFQTDLRGEFDRSVALLAPLKERLAATDRLIDQVVYRLYGLTPAEVAIIEGHAEGETTTS